MSIELRFARLGPGDGDVDLPSYATEGSSGMDVRAAVTETLTLEPGARAAVPTGLAVEIPAGFELQVRPRSGLALKHGIMVVNAPGTIDSDYRGEIRVILGNTGSEAFRIERGDRIAQLVLAPVTRARIVLGEGLGMTDRGDGGFGSTGR